MEIYLHKESENMIIVFPVWYQYKVKGVPSTGVMFSGKHDVDVSYYDQVGVAVENKHGFTFIAPSFWNDDNAFEFIGEL